MNLENNRRTMDQRIFNMGLPTETVSLYLLCCGLSDSGVAISRANLVGIWNSTEDALAKGLETLEEYNILTREISDSEADPVYQLTNPKQWKA